MKTYILKLKTTSTTNYNLYDGTTLVSDSDLATLFGSAGSAYFTFDFNEGTPTNTTSLTILNSQDTAVMTNTGLEGITEDRNFKGVWADSATAFTSFALLKGVAMDEAELTTLVGMVKNAGGIKTLTSADYNYHYGSMTDDGVALWLLNDSFYITGTQLKLYPRTDQSNTVPAGTIVIKSNYNIVAFAKGIETGGATNSKTTIGHWLTNENGNKVTTGATADYLQNSILTESQVANSLTTSASGRRVLDAYQGKVLNEKIGDLTTLTTTANTSTVAAINELDSEMPVITMTTTDPGEGSPLAANSFIAVY